MILIKKLYCKGEKFMTTTVKKQKLRVLNVKISDTHFKVLKSKIAYEGMTARGMVERMIEMTLPDEFKGQERLFG